MEGKRPKESRKRQSLVPYERIEQSILFIRGQKVILDRGLTIMYGIETKVLKQAVKRNINRFPEDFMFVLTSEEFTILRSQFVTSKSDPRGGTRYTPMAFTEQSVAMLSGVLNSP
jgi:hypothetical protein